MSIACVLAPSQVIVTGPPPPMTQSSAARAAPGTIAPIKTSAVVDNKVALKFKLLLKILPRKPSGHSLQTGRTHLGHFFDEGKTGNTSILNV